MAGFEIGGRKLKVSQAMSSHGPGGGGGGGGGAAAAMPPLFPPLMGVAGGHFPGFMPGVVPGFMPGAAPAAPVNLNAIAAAAAAALGPTAAAAAAAFAPPPPAPAAGAGAPSSIVAIRNMVTAEEVDDPDLPGEIREEAERHGAVASVAVRATAAGGGATVFVRYASPAAAGAAVPKLDRRFFGGRVTAAGLYPEAAFAAGDFERPL
jgi:hypothetical protein